MRAYYNEIDPYAAQWLRNLIAHNLIAPGDVDTRPIQDVAPDDLAPYAQCHFFAGIGGWSRALRLAAVPDHCPVWTGSCPCQPFSAAGRRGGFADERHLWPFFHHHIRVRRPAVVLGEQVGGPAGLAWLDLVCADMEAEGYAVGAADLPAACVGAPHIRQRLFWVADASSPERRPAAEEWHEPDRADAGRQETASGHRLYRARRLPGSLGGICGIEESAGPRDAESQRRGFWDDLDWLPCADGKWRPTKPGLFPLSARVPNRVAQLRAIGNAIVPQVAAEFIRAALGY